MPDQRGMTFGINFGVDTASLDKAAQKTEELKDTAEEAAESLDSIGMATDGMGESAAASFGMAADGAIGLQQDAGIASDVISLLGAIFEGMGLQAQGAGDDAAAAVKLMQAEVASATRDFDDMGINIGAIGATARKAFASAAGASQTFGASVRTAMMQSLRSGEGLNRVIASGLSAALKTGTNRVKAFGKTFATTAKTIGTALKHPIQTIKATLGHALVGAANNMKELGASGEDAAKGIGKVAPEAEKAAKSVQGVGDMGKQAGNGLVDMGQRGIASVAGLIAKVTLLGTALAGIALAKKTVELIKDFGVAAVEAAANAEETRSKFEVVFGDQSDQALKWAENFADAAKRSQVEIEGFMSSGQALFTGVGMGREEASEMSKVMTSLAYDLGSFHNLADEDAFAKLRSGILGETEGLKQMGIVLNETTLKESMMEMGLKGTFKELDESTKMHVRMNAILAQTADAQTDVTRTSDSYTNSVKGMQGVWQDFLATAGAEFTPVLTNLFNSILDSWPTIEPMLMGLVNVLSEGLSAATPVLLDLGMTLLPTLTTTLGSVLDAIVPLIPEIGAMAGELLPQLMEGFAVVLEAVIPMLPVFTQLAAGILPVLIQAMSMVFQALTPLLPPFLALASQLLPVLAQVLMVVIQAFQPLLPIIVQLAGQLLPPLVNIITMLASVLSPVIEIIGIIASILLPLWANQLSNLVTAFLPPLLDILGMLAPLLEFIAPLFDVMAAGVGLLTEMIGGVVGWLVDGVSAIGDFFGELFGWTEEVAEETGVANDGLAELGDTVNSFSGTQIEPITFEVGEMPEIQAYEPETVEIPVTPDIQQPDMSAYANLDYTLPVTADVTLPETGNMTLDIPTEVTPPDTDKLVIKDVPVPDTTKYTTTINNAVTQTGETTTTGWQDVQNISANALDAMGDAGSSTYGGIADDAVSAWSRMTNAAENAVSKIVSQFDKLRQAAQRVGNINITGGGVSLGGGLPHNAAGDDNFGGGWTYVNEQGGELAYLPGGSAIIPADQTDQIISGSGGGKGSTQIVINNYFQGGIPTDEEAAAWEDKTRALINQILDARDDDDADDESIAFGY